ncbi:hypothetical protein KR044_003971, partial [Drosophila immigrans]
MMFENLNAFADPDKLLPFNTKVVAYIRTEDNESVYSKIYPFPMGVADFVNREIKDLLKNGIIRPPYKYPMPSISMILSNLGKASYFTTLDFKSGYHQINLAECDRERTSFSVNSGKYEFCRIFILFGSKTRHLITFISRECLLDLVKNVVTPNVVNAIYCELPILAHIQDKLVKLFPATKFWHC